MLTAQAKLGGLRLVSRDREIRRYDCDVAWE
jgi:PIN domain nuclease of toxin-antitoxin system